MRYVVHIFCLVLCGPLSISFHAWGATAPPKNPRYQIIADDEYLQEVGRKIVTAQPVIQLVAHRDSVFAVSGDEVYALKNERLEPLSGIPARMRRLFSVGGQLWGATDDATYLLESTGISKVLEEPLVGMCLHEGQVYGASQTDIYRLEGRKLVNIRPEQGWLSSDSTLVMEDGTQVLADPVTLGPIEQIASYHETLYLLRPQGLALLEGRVFQTEPVDWGTIRSNRHRDMLAVGSRLCIATDKGVSVLRGAALTTLNAQHGLPYEDATCLASGFAGDLWIGTTTGAIRQTTDEYHYFGADHWLPSDNVHSIAVSDRTVYIATDGGIGVIHYEPYTLRKKADYFQHNVARREHQRLGFVHQLYWSDAENGWLREVSDNDGGHTAHYLAAMCFKYAVTGDASARGEARDAFEAMVWLQTITGTDGFFARSIWAQDVDQGQRGMRGSGGLPAKWYETDDGRWLWKGDTSSDEVNAHFYAVSLFHDLVAEGKEKKLAAQHLGRIALHIIDNGWVLRDMDGQPTRWGRWDPDYLLRPYGFEARGLNGMEAQTYMWTAYKLTGKPVYREGLDQLLRWRYHTYTVREKLTFPPESVVPWDDELAFRCFHPLLTYCDDSYLRSIYLRALARHWEVMRMQKLPFFNFIYGALTGNDCEEQQAVEHLRQWSLDTVSHSYRNSHRADLQGEPGYTPYMGGTRAISPRESACMWGSRSALRYDGGGGGRIITPPVGWLEDYWMGRFYGMIAAPTADDPRLTAVTGEEVDVIGAEPYEGPARPALNVGRDQRPQSRAGPPAALGGGAHLRIGR